MAMTRPHLMFGLSAQALRQAACILGDEFSAMGVGVALGLPRDAVENVLLHLASEGWIAPLLPSRERLSVFGPWFEPRPAWQQLRSARMTLPSQQVQMALAVDRLVQQVRQANRQAARGAVLVDGLSKVAAARPAGAAVRLVLVMSFSEWHDPAVAGCAPHHGVRPTQLWRRRMSTISALLELGDPASITAAAARLRPLYNVAHDVGLWFDSDRAVKAFPNVYLRCAQEWSERPLQSAVHRHGVHLSDIRRATTLAHAHLLAAEVQPVHGGTRGPVHTDESAFGELAKQLLRHAVV